MLTLRRWRACVSTFTCTGEPLCMYVCQYHGGSLFSPPSPIPPEHACTHSPVADVPPVGMLPSMVRIVVAGHVNHFNNGYGARRQTTSTTKLK